MPRSDLPPENPFASPQADDEPTPQEAQRVDAVGLQRQLRWLWFWCLFSAGMYAAFAVLILGNIIERPGVSVLIVFLVMVLSMSLAFAYVIAIGGHVEGLWFGLLCGVLMALLGFTLVIGYVLIPSWIHSVFNRRYGHLLNTPDHWPDRWYNRRRKGMFL